MSTIVCPKCGFTARKLCSDGNRRWKYICERCGYIFTVG